MLRTHELKGRVMRTGFDAAAGIFITVREPHPFAPSPERRPKPACPIDKTEDDCNDDR